MPRALFTVVTEHDRRRVLEIVQRVPLGTRVEFKDGRRSPAQNDRLWAMLTDIAQQVEWYGRKLKTNDWKLIFLEALRRENRTVPNLSGTGLVNLGRSSSALTKDEMSDLLELIAAFGAERGVIFHDRELPISETT